MGLALVNKTVDHFGGKLEIESDGKLGTTVVVYWPVNTPAVTDKKYANTDS